VTIFGFPWSDLRLEHVQAFLEDAGGESLTWEAKGTELPHPGTVAKHLVGFANGLEPGYLLLGFEQAGDVWKATGLKFPRNDPPVWVANSGTTSERWQGSRGRWARRGIRTWEPRGTRSRHARR
jgi:hypothetical protein